MATRKAKSVRSGTARQLRNLIRKAIREGVAMTRYEEQCIEDAFVRLARAAASLGRRMKH